MNYIVLVNKNNKCDFENKNLIDIINFDNKIIKIDKKVYKQYLKLKRKMNKFNYTIDIESSYRSFEEQKNLFYEIASLKGINHALKYVARPGYSEHQTGFAIDISLIKNNKSLYDFYIDDNDFFKILHQNLANYGFILRYPKNKDCITGYSYEPWHIRYIGKNDAKYIYKNNLCLEEYVTI